MLGPSGSSLLWYFHALSLCGLEFVENCMTFVKTLRRLPTIVYAGALQSSVNVFC